MGEPGAYGCMTGLRMKAQRLLMLGPTGYRQHALDEDVDDALSEWTAIGTKVEGELRLVREQIAQCKHSAKYAMSQGNRASAVANMRRVESLRAEETTLLNTRASADTRRRQLTSTDMDQAMFKATKKFAEVMRRKHPEKDLRKLDDAQDIIRDRLDSQGDFQSALRTTEGGEELELKDDDDLLAELTADIGMDIDMVNMRATKMNPFGGQMPAYTEVPLMPTSSRVQPRPTAELRHPPATHNGPETMINVPLHGVDPGEVEFTFEEPPRRNISVSNM
jgi:hypothetical protein